MPQSSGPWAHMPHYQPQTWADWIERRLAATVAIIGALAVVIALTLIGAQAVTTAIDGAPLCPAQAVACR